jgi:uncharacterized protein DUF6894
MYGARHGAITSFHQRMNASTAYVVNHADDRGVDMLTDRNGRRTNMPRYKFKLNDDSGGVEDGFGVNLPNGEIAQRYACDVVRELMDHRERKTRHWRLEVYQDNGEKVFDIPFAKLDQALDGLHPQSRALVKLCAQQVRSLKDAYDDASLTWREARSLVARSRGKPYLAVDHGRKVIRDRS